MVELPGVDAGDLRSRSANGRNDPRGEKRATSTPRARVSTPPNWPFGRFRSSAGPVNTHRAKAVLDNGLLRIRFPKVPNRRGEEVPIEVRTT